MNVQAFWNVIGNYNEQTKIIQIGLLIFVILAIALSYIRKVNWAAKFALGLESWHNKNDLLEKPAPFIMPCPIVSLSITVYAGYKRKIYCFLSY